MKKGPPTKKQKKFRHADDASHSVWDFFYPYKPNARWIREGDLHDLFFHVLFLPTSGARYSDTMPKSHPLTHNPNL